jgi:hypothetical protein
LSQSFAVDSREGWVAAHNREVMRAKGRGRYALMLGDMLRGTPLEHYRALYEAVREFGGYPRLQSA